MVSFVRAFLFQTTTLFWKQTSFNHVTNRKWTPTCLMLIIEISKSIKYLNESGRMLEGVFHFLGVLCQRA